MKINSNKLLSNIGKKVLINIMRTFIFLCFTTVFGLTPNTIISQNSKVKIDSDKVLTVDQVFDLIMDQTDYKFIYQEGIFDDFPKVQVKKGTIKANRLLNKSLSSGNFNIVVTNDNTVLIKKKPGTLVPLKNKQEHEVSGTVTDQSGQPLPGANILEKGTTNGVQTDFDGNYSIHLSTGNTTLVISYIGFKTQEILVENKTKIDIVLIEDASVLDEVVLVGYGSVAKKDLTGAVSSVKNIEDRAVTNTEEALQGNVSGVTVIGDGGDPTSVPKVRIRGVGTTSDESPLWIVDGVPYYGGPLNPFDIESMAILKDASATAIYGVRAAGGVILVTTKKGRDGDLKIDFNAYTGTQSVWKKPKALNAAQQAEYYNISADNSGLARDPVHDPSQNPDGQITRTNWVDEIFQTGFIQNYDLGIRGGNQNYIFSSSLGYNEREGTLLNTIANRITARFNSEFRINDKLKVGENISYTRINGNSAFTGTQAANGETNYNGIIAQAIKAPPHLSVYDENGNYSNMPDAGYGLTIHPVSTLKRIDIDHPTTDLFGNLYLDYDILEGLKFKSSFGINFKNESYKEFDPRVPEVSKTQKTTNSLQVAEVKQIDWSLENTISYNKTFKDIHALTLLGGYTLQSYSQEYFSIIGRDLSSEDSNSLFLVNATSFDKPVQGKEENRLTSYFGRVNYTFKDRYLLTASVRRDGTSKLAKENRWGTFPSLALAWKLSEENFLKESKSINSLKLRTSWGRIGNISSLSNYPTNVPLSETQVILGLPNYVSGFALDGISNPDIVWETTEQLNFGVDLSMLDSRLTLTADYFIKDTKDLILPLPISSLAGVSNAPFVNAGQVRNKGVELSLGYQKYEGDFTYNISANISKINNELVALDNGITNILDFTQVATHFPIESVIGEPLFSFYLLEADGIFQSDSEASADTAHPNAVAGDLRFKDQNNDGVINGEDKVYKGSAFPDFTYGLNATFNYKNFDLNLFFQGVSGSKAYNGFKLTTLYPAQTSVAGANLSAEAVNTWHPGNMNASNFRLSNNDPNNNLRPSDFWLESTDYLRLKNLTIGYTFPESKFYSRLRAYVSGQNLFTITNYSGLDPEVANKGIDGGQYPISRIFTLGINLTF
ncbi:TonB-dependent receptor [Seonamhaeicola sp.]|uniref:SusC/RagA family TonB-linked outer membrane protein n=1 Tax=Seonamhaeicola sp. TaxID=1912245 RepID=UPI00262BB2AC|nr:TonB-dependent receptor [Seonamhaeicola sp.]